MLPIKKIKRKKLSNKKSLLLTLLVGLMFGSVSAFADYLTERSIYNILSENFTGALMTRGESTDNIRFNTWGSPAPAADAKTDASSAKEGKVYWQIDCNAGTGACSFTFVKSNNTTAQTTDISHFKYLDFWIRKQQGDIGELKVGVTAGALNRTVQLSSYVDNSLTTWQHVVIDLTTLNANLNSVTNVFLADCSNLTGRTVFDVDNIVLRTADNSSASFNVDIKNIEDYGISLPDNPTQITFVSSVFQNSWQSACQYLELDMDMYSCAWTVRIYTNNGASGRGGMYATAGGKDYVIPMCWRAYDGTLVNTVGNGDDTYLMAQSSKSHHNIYDRGKSPSIDPDYYPWLYIKEYEDINFNDSGDIDYITVWDSKFGYHGFSAANINEGFYPFAGRVERKPKLYFGGGFDSAAGGLEYTANIVLELNYE